MSSSGEVLPLGFSVRVAKLMGAPLQAPLLARSKVPDPLCRLPFQTTSARLPAVATSAPICFLRYYGVHTTQDGRNLIFQRGVYPDLDVVLEGVGDGADLVHLLDGLLEAFGVELRVAAPDVEVHRGDPEPFGDLVEGAGGLTVYALRRRTALAQNEGEGRGVAARVGRGHELLGARARGPGDGDLAHHPAAHRKAAPALFEGSLPADLGPPPRRRHKISSGPCTRTNATRARVTLPLARGLLHLAPVCFRITSFEAHGVGGGDPPPEQEGRLAQGGLEVERDEGRGGVLRDHHVIPAQARARRR